MPRNITQFDLLISCPSDVEGELEIIKETVEEFNRIFGVANNCSIVTKHWSKDSYPQSGGKPQQLLNEQFVLGCDAAVAVFWTRFGTPTDKYGSGTEEEIEELLKSGKQVFLYFCDRPINPSRLDAEQYAKVTEFKEKYKDKGIYSPYSELSDFKKNFLNHLSLHFLKLLSNEGTNKVREKSKLSINGVVEGKISENSIMYNINLLASKFMTEKTDSISGKFEHIKKVKLQKEPDVKKVISETSNNDSSNKLNSLSNVGKVSLESQERMKKIISIFSSSKVELNESIITSIKKYAQKNNININDKEFFYVGNLHEKNQPFGGGPFGTEPSYSIEGAEEEKEKYDQILELHDEIIKYAQWEMFFKGLSSKYYLKLALCNSGKSFDEDIDIKIYIKSGVLCKREQLPFPGEDILEDVNTIELIDILFKPNKSLSAIEYEDYPTSIPAIEIPSSISRPTYRENIEAEKKTYKNTIESLFCYEYFQDNNFDVICFKQSYLKQNTNVLFPTILVFNAYVDSINLKFTQNIFQK